MNRKKLLSIGEISKLTGASHRSLRYYERIGLLEPAFIDPDSGYRYYSFDQVYLIDIIKFCIELDVPLKVLEEYVDASGVIDIRALLQYGKQTASGKLKTLHRGLRFIQNMEQEIALAEKYQQGGEIYTREVPEKIVYAHPCAQSFDEADPLEIAKEFYDASLEIEAEEQLWEFGLLCEYTPKGASRYVFTELKVDRGQENIKVIPGGTYYCRLGETSAIEQAAEIFREQLEGVGSFLVIETEIFTGKHQIGRPLNELRVRAVGS